MMIRERALELLSSDYGMDDETIYLLPVIPLIEMMWVDGQNQGDETLLIYDYVSRQRALIKELTDGEVDISMAHAKQFLDPFIVNRPPKDLLVALRQIVNETVNDDTTGMYDKDEILDYCMDIAAAAVTHYPYDKRDRFVVEEKQLFKQLCNALS